MNKVNFSEELYKEATILSQHNYQTVGENNDYYITLRQLKCLLSNNPTKYSATERLYKNRQTGKIGSFSNILTDMIDNAKFNN